MYHLQPHVHAAAFSPVHVVDFVSLFPQTASTHPCTTTCSLLQLSWLRLSLRYLERELHRMQHRNRIWMGLILLLSSFALERLVERKNHHSVLCFGWTCWLLWTLTCRFG